MVLSSRFVFFLILLMKTFILSLIAIFMLSTGISYGSVGGYVVTTGSGSRLSAPNVLWQGYQGSRWSYDYAASGLIGLPFNFTFDGTSYSTFQIYAAGAITLGNTSLSSPPANQLNGNNGAVIAPFWDNLHLTGCQRNWSSCQFQAQVSYGFIGSAPNRIVVVDWQHVEAQAYYETYVNMQVRLYEGGKIEFWYGIMGEQCGSTYNLPTSASIGLSTSSTNYLSLTPAGTSMSKSTSSGNNSITLSGTPIPTNLLVSFVQVPNVQLSSSPKVVNFGSVATGNFATANVTVTNAGTNTQGTSRLSIRSTTLTGSADFSIVSAPLSSDSIDVGQTRTIVLKFTPATDGLKNGSLTITSNGLDSGTQVISLTGIGLAPLISVDTNVLFKNKLVKLGDSLVRKITIFSTNIPALAISSFQIVGADAGEYYISRLPSSMTIPGGSQDSVFIGYRPTKEGRHIATLNIVNNSVNNPSLPITLWGTGILPHITIAPNPMLFDSTSIGIDTCKKIRIYNPGTDTLLIKSNMLVSNDGDFTYSGLVGADSIIPPDKFKEVTVCFQPKAKGSRVARLRITTNIPKTFEQPSRDTASLFLIDIRGTGVPTGLLSQTIGGAEGAGWTDSTLIGTQICINDSITNNGDADILISNISLSGAAASAYKITGPATPFILKAKSTIVINICATPKSRGFQTATLNIDGSASEKPVHNIAMLNVKGLLACANALPTALFEQTLVVKGTDTSLCTTVTNCGDIVATYTATITGDTANVYSVTPGSSATVNPGQSATFCVKYSPSAAGKSPATLTISAPNTPNQVVTLNGEGACAIVNAQLPNLQSMGKGGKYQITLTITNTGNYTWTPTGIQGLDSAILHYLSGLDPIAPGGNIQIVLEVTPDDINHHYNFPLTISGVPCEESAATATVDFTTTSTGVPNLVTEAGFVLGQNHPNPFTASTEFSFTTPTEANVILSIHDITGKLVKVITSGTVTSGEHIVKLSADEFASGSYLLTLESGSVKLTRQIMIAK
jgi:hypothetical protein